jgi:hypothetical protein
VDEDYYYSPVDLEVEKPEYYGYYHGYGHCRRVCYPRPGDRGRHPWTY